MSEESANEAKIVVRLKDEALIDQLCTRARQAVLTWLRGRSVFVFWVPEIQERFSFFDFGRFLGIARSEKLDLPSVAKALVRRSPMSFRTFEANWSGEDNQPPWLLVRLKGASEWSEVVNEAWEGLQRPPYNLSEPAGRLLSWAMAEQNHNVWIQRATIGRQAGLRGTSWTGDFLANHFKEIERKSNVGLKFERNEDEFRVSTKSDSKPELPVQRHGPLNPVLTLDFKKLTFGELDRFRETVYDWILKAELPADGQALAIWYIHDRATLDRCFPAWSKENWEVSTLFKFLGEVALDHGLLWGYSFQDPNPWFYECGPKAGSTWADVKASILQSRSLPPLAERYGISTEAAAVVKWFTTLRPKEWLGNLTPSLEDNLKTRIGLSTNWDNRNLSVYFSILAEEISERTEWKVTVHPWSGGWTGASHRLLVKRKVAPFEQIVQQVQILAISRGKVVKKDRIEAALNSVLEGE